MRNMMIALAFVTFFAGCDKASDTPAETAGHQHTAPHGGILAELGEHEAAAEAVLDRETGTLTLYILDGHAENPIRIAQDAIVVSVLLGDAEELLAMPLTPVASQLTGEKAGDTSQFQVQHESLKHAGKALVETGELKVRDNTYENVTFEFVP